MLYHEEYEHCIFTRFYILNAIFFPNEHKVFLFFLSSRATEYDFPRGLLEAARDKGRVTIQRTRL